MEVEQEYAPSLVPKAEPMRARQYIPAITNVDQLNKIKQIDELYSIDLTKPEDYHQQKAESYAIPGKFITKDENFDQDLSLKMQVLVDKLKEYKEKIINLRTQNLESVKSNIEKSQEIERLKIKVEALEKQISEYEFLDGRKGFGGIIKVKEKSSLEEQLKRKQEMQQELMMGINLVGGDDLNDLLGREIAKKNLLTKVKEAFVGLVNKFIILKADYRRIESRYDKSIAAYFGFYKFLVNLSILILAIYCYLLISHMINFDDSLVSTCSGTLCFTLYYSFNTDEASTYILTFIGMILVTVIAAITKWVRADKLKVRSEIYGGNEAKLKKFSAIVFNSWPWAINSEVDTSDQFSNIQNLISNAIAETIKQQNAANRTAKQKTALLGKRIIGSSIFLFILMSGWVIIALLALSEKNIASNFENSGTALRLFMRFLPKFGISAVNAMFPALTSKITAVESWDTSSFIITVQIIRIYLAKVLNIVLYALLNLELATDNVWFLSNEGSIPFQPSNFNCREDQAGINLAILVITEAILGKLIPLGFVLIDWSIAKCRKQPSWKKEIKVAQQVINAIYFQGLLWITFPYFPYIMILAPIFLFIDFKFQSWRLRTIQVKPLEQTQSYDVLILIMRLFNITVLMILGYFGFFLTVKSVHGTYGSNLMNCGPFESKTSANDALITDMKNTVVISQIWDYILNYSPVFWVVFIILITQILFKRNKLAILEEFMRDRQYETEQKLQELQKKNAQLLKREQYKENNLRTGN